jgi:hypothetical protein
MSSTSVWSLVPVVVATKSAAEEVVDGRMAQKRAKTEK